MWELADFDGGVAVRAGQVGLAGGLEDEPGDVEGGEGGEALGVGHGFEAGLGGLAEDPGGGEVWRDAGFAAVFGVVGEGGALGDGAEGLGVFAVAAGDVAGVEGEEGVFGGVVAGPEEGLDPGVRWGAAGEFKVVRGGEGAALDVEHEGSEGEEEGGPAPGVELEEMVAEPGAEEEDHELVDELVTAEGLHAGDEVGAEVGAGEEDGDGEGDGAEEEGGAGEGSPVLGARV